MGDELTVRLARPEDYDDVMAIQKDLWEGGDYLPELYHECFDDPNMIMCVAEIDGKWVSLSSITSVLNGEAGLDCMSRTHPAYEKRGIHSRLRKHKIDLFLRQHPSVTSVLYTAVESEFHMKRLQEERFSLLYRSNLFKIATDTAKLRRDLDKVLDECIDMEHLTPDLLAQLDITGVIGTEYFFTGLMWTPHQPNQSDILDILRDHSGLVTLCPKDSAKISGTPTSASTTKTSVMKQTLALSLFYSKAIQDKRCYHFYFFGNIKSFLAHFSKQLKTTFDHKLSSERDVLIYVYFQEDNNVDDMKGILQGFAGQERWFLKPIIVKEDISR